jgi:cyclophilin family peptidyl-prolyl cis-trans isomerase
MRIVAITLAIFSLTTSTFAQPAAEQTAAANPYGLPDGLYSEITTPKGVVVCELFYKKTPMTVANYVGLAEGTLGPEPRQPFFNGSPYHRIVPGYVLQGGGRPRGNAGRGGNEGARQRGRRGGRGGGLGYSFPDEFVPGLRHDAAGILQMANGGPGTNGSQHCIMLGPAQRLNYLHTVFGRVVRGEDVPAKIVQDETMQQVKILRIGRDAQAFKADEATFNALVAKAKTNPGPHYPGPETHFHDPDGLLPTEPPRELHFNMKLANFQIFTGQRIIARILAKMPDRAEGTEFEKYLDELAEKMGVAKAGALVVYVADQDKWFVRIGPDAAASFIAGPRAADGTKMAAPAGKTLAAATQEFLESTNAQAAELIEAASQAPAPNDSVSDQQKLKLHVDATLDELIFRLEPAADAR